MKAIGIITDSHSGITQKEAKQRKIQVLPTRGQTQICNVCTLAPLSEV